MSLFRHRWSTQNLELALFPRGIQPSRRGCLRQRGNRFAANASRDSISMPNGNNGSIRASISPPKPSTVMVSPTATLLPVDAEPFADERPFILGFEDLTELAFFTGGGGTAAVPAGALRLRSSTMIGCMIVNRDEVGSKGKTDGLNQERRRKGRKVNKIHSTTRADGRG